jgi:hypothetical protein
MKPKATSKVLRVALIAFILVIALVSGGALDKSGCVEAKTCDEAWVDYLNANTTYEIARVSYFYGVPTTCQQDCVGNPNPTQCVDNCQINRHTALGSAETGLFNDALGTCTPITIDQCAQARAIADDCAAQYDFMQYSDLEERLAVWAQYDACREASKVDTCE